MILKYYGGYVKKSNLQDMTKTNKNGTTAYNIKDTLINLGFDAKGIKCKLEDISEGNIVLPCIANVIIDNSYKHFIVIYEISFKHKYLIIGDPIDKVKKMKFDEFVKIFNNVLIICYPIKTLPIESNISQINFILKLLKPHKKNLVNIFILSFFITLFSIITSFYTEYMINSLNYYSKTYLLFIFCIFFSIHILKIISDFFRNKLLLFINQKLDLILTLDVFNKIIMLPYCYYQKRTTGDIVSRINDLEYIKECISKVSLSLFVDLPLTVLSLILLFILNKTLFCIGIVMLILYFILILIFKDSFNDYIKKIQILKGGAVSYIVEAINGYETIKGLHISSSIKSRFEYKYVKYLKKVFNFQNLYLIQNMFKDIINNIGFIFITLIGCILVINDKIELGTLFTFSSLLIYFLDPIKNIINLDSTVKESKNAINRILDVIYYKKESYGIFKEFNCKEILFRNLNFSFNERDYVLKNINLEIKQNSKVMVIGKSGSGKSTLFKLLARFYKADNNKIFIGNVDLNSIDEKVINNNILYLGQNEILFNDTLYNNLIFDNSDSSNLNSIAKMCFIDEILDNNLGYNMLIEEGGFNLSGGEKQRIFLARMLLRKFNILVIDEGLSQVDIQMERKILSEMFQYFKDKTIIFISHRIDNLDLFDKLVKIDNGVIYDG